MTSHDLDTPYIMVPGRFERYCPYCGKEIKRHESLVPGMDYYACDCADALAARQILERIDKLQKQLPAEKYHIAPTIVKW